MQTSFGQLKQQPDPNEETVSGFGGMKLDNDTSMATSKANETKMSDNEAFMAYMSKAEAGDDDDE